MKEAMKYVLAIAITAAAMFACMYDAPPEGVGQEMVDLSAALSTEHAIDSEKSPSKDVAYEETKQETLTDKEIFNNAKKRLGVGYDPMLLFASAEFTDEEIATYNKYHILPFNPVVDEVCYDVIAEDNTNYVGTQCKRIRERPDPHSYASIAKDELQALAVTDAAAALFMGIRAETYIDSLRWHLRATALSNKTGPLMIFSTRGAQSAGRNITENSTEQDGFYRTYMQLAIKQLASDLGDPRADTETHISWLESQDYPEIIPEIARTAAEELWAEIALIQTEIGVTNDA